MQKPLLTALFVSLFIAYPVEVRAANEEPFASAKLAENPFAGACENVALLHPEVYAKNKAAWDAAIVECNAQVQVLPEAGFFSTMLGTLGKITGNDAEKARAVAFVRKVGEKTLDNLRHNAKETERQIYCAKGEAGAAWFAEKRAAAKSDAEFYDPAVCPAVLRDLKAAIAEKGPEFRIELALMQNTAGLGSQLASVARTAFRQAFPGEKLALSDSEKKIVQERIADTDRRTTESLRADADRFLKEFEKTKTAQGREAALALPNLPQWFKGWYRESNQGANPASAQARIYWNEELSARKQLEFNGHYEKFTKALAAAPIVSYLEARDPTDAALEQACSKLLANNQRVAQDVTNLLAKTATKPGEYYGLSDQDKIDELLPLLQNGAVVRSVLAAKPEYCGSAAGLVGFVKNRKQRNGAVAAIGLIGAGLLAPLAAGPMGVYVGTAGAGFTVTGSALAGALGTAAAGATLYADHARARDGERRVLAYAHDLDGKLGAGLPIADSAELLDARNALAIDAALFSASLATAAGTTAYAKLFAGAGSKLQSPAVMRALTTARDQGGAGLTEAEASHLLRSVVSNDRAAAQAALKKLYGYLGGDAHDLEALQALVRRELADPNAKLTIEGLSEKLAALKSPVRGPADLYALEVESRREGGKVVSQFITDKASGLARHLKETVVDEYVNAWKSGADVPAKAANLAKRFVFVPRSRATDPALLQGELRNFNEISIFDPAVSGVVEVANQGKILLGAHLGFSSEPLAYRLSMPATAIAGSFAYPAVGKATKPVVDHYLDRKRDAIDDADKKGVLGLPAMKDWLSVGEFDLRGVRTLANENSEQIIAWVKGIEEGKPGRPQLPRLYQFRLHGLLAGDKEAAEFEKLLIGVLEENARRVEKGEKITGDPWVKAEILRRLQGNPVFSAKKPSELRLLTLAFDPPVFLGKHKGDFSWVKELRDGNPTRYRESLLKESDLFWLLQADNNPEMKSLNDYFGEDPSPLKATVARSQAYTESRAVIEEKKKRWDANPSLPPAKRYLATRTDMPFFVEPKLTWADGSGQEKPMASELDYWELLASHDSFAGLRKDWLEGKISDKTVISRVRSQIPDYAVVHLWQADGLQHAREQDPQRNTPLDPLPKEVCKIREDNPTYTGLAAEFSGSSESAICRYYGGVYAWRWIAQDDQNYRARSKAEFAERERRQAEWKERAQRDCSQPGRSDSLSRVFGVKSSELNSLLSCP